MRRTIRTIRAIRTTMRRTMRKRGGAERRRGEAAGQAKAGRFGVRASQAERNLRSLGSAKAAIFSDLSNVITISFSDFATAVELDRASASRGPGHSADGPTRGHATSATSQDGHVHDSRHLRVDACLQGHHSPPQRGGETCRRPGAGKIPSGPALSGGFRCIRPGAAPL